jgi:7-carboxy-7-deazaguanine synthase
MPFFEIPNRPSFTIDYKLPGSGMEREMYLMNFRHADKQDTIKFVVSDDTDLIKAAQIIEKFELQKRTSVYISPVFGKITPDRIVDFMKEKKLNNVNLQLQLHKIIWSPDQKGV